MYFLRTAFVQPTYSIRIRTVFVRCLYDVYTVFIRHIDKGQGTRDKGQTTVPRKFYLIIVKGCGKRSILYALPTLLSFVTLFHIGFNFCNITKYILFLQKFSQTLTN